VHQTLAVPLSLPTRPETNSRTCIDYPPIETCSKADNVKQNFNRHNEEPFTSYWDRRIRTQGPADRLRTGQTAGNSSVDTVHVMQDVYILAMVAQSNVDLTTYCSNIQQEISVKRPNGTTATSLMSYRNPLAAGPCRMPVHFDRPRPPGKHATRPCVIEQHAGGIRR
jgi:hypothetical protein